MIVVADTGAILALLDSSARHHTALVGAYQSDPSAWVLPWAILPEIDYLASMRLGAATARAFRADVASGRFQVEWQGPLDMERAAEIDAAHAGLDLGLVDTVVMALAERLGAKAIATLDLRDFGTVRLRNAPEIWPRDLIKG